MPTGYIENLISGVWESQETITTTAGNQNIIRRQQFLSDGFYTIQVDHPVTGSITRQFLYKVGYYSPKPAIILYDINNPNSVVSLPIFFYFSNNILITSTNAGLEYALEWYK